MGGAANRIFWLLLQGLILCMSPVSASSCSASTFSELQTCITNQETDIVVTKSIAYTATLEITKDGTSISSTAGDRHTLDGQSTYRLFSIKAGVGTVHFRNLALANGYSSDGIGGNAIRGSTTDLTLTNVSFTNCVSALRTSLGGALQLNNSHLKTRNCSFSDNYLVASLASIQLAYCSAASSTQSVYSTTWRPIYNYFWWDSCSDSYTSCSGSGYYEKTKCKEPYWTGSRLNSKGGAMYLRQVTWDSKHDDFQWDSDIGSGDACDGSATMGGFIYAVEATLSLTETTFQNGCKYMYTNMARC